jgi:hypothetical protein
MDLLLILLFVSLIRKSIGSYFLFPVEVNFTQAIQKCSSINATVLFIDNSTEDTYIKNTFLNGPLVTTAIWLAIYDIFGNETNVNYYTNKTLNYTNWVIDRTSDKCFRYVKNGNWLDYGCDASFSTLCEYSTIQTGFTVTNMSATMTTPESSTIYQTTITQSPSIATTETIISNIINNPLWNKWNPWSFFQLYRQRNNSNINNGFENEIINVSCSLVCKHLILI